MSISSLLPVSEQSGSFVKSNSPILTEDNRWPSAFASAQCAAVRITRLEIMEPVHGYTKFPLFKSVQEFKKYFLIAVL